MKRRKKILFGIISLVVYLTIDFVEVLSFYKVETGLSFVRAVAICIFLYLCMLSIKPLWDKNFITRGLHDLMMDCGKFSLQLYLFNGYLLTILRALICSVFHISEPIVIVLGIWIGDVLVTLVMCKVIVSRVSGFGFLCGLK